MQSHNSRSVSEASSIEGDEPAAPENDNGEDQQDLVVQAVQDLTAGYEQHYLDMTTTVEQHILTLGRQLADCAEEVRAANAQTRARIEEMFGILMTEINKLKDRQIEAEKASRYDNEATSQECTS